MPVATSDTVTLRGLGFAARVVVEAVVDDVTLAPGDRWWTRFVYTHCILVLVWVAVGLMFTRNIDHRYTANPPPLPKPGHARQHPISSLGSEHHLFPLQTSLISHPSPPPHPQKRPSAHAPNTAD